MYAIFRIKKLKSLEVIDRLSVSNTADLGLTAKEGISTWFFNSLHGAFDACEAVISRLGEYYPGYPDGDCLPRVNAVLAVECFLSASAEFFDLSTQEDTTRWMEANIKWLERFWGAENVIQCVSLFNRDVPCIRAIVLPIIDDRLNCRKKLGDAQRMTEIQSEYAEAMKEFGLKRGQKVSDARVRKIKEIKILGEPIKVSRIILNDRAEDVIVLRENEEALKRLEGAYHA